MSEVEKVAGIRDARERAIAAQELIDRYNSQVNELAPVRKGAILELLSSGMNQTEIARVLGLGRGRISQILKADVSTNRPFFGTGDLVIAIGAKSEAGKSKDPSSMVSAEAFSAFETLAQAARSVGLEATYEVVPPPGMVHLNRDNLIVLTNPRLLPFLSQVLEADPHLKYLKDDRGWYIVDQATGTEYRSLRDEGKPSDYAYVGRLPRPDGKGTFLYLAGTHAPGTLGAAHFVADNVTELFREVKNGRFSTVIECQFEPGNQLNILSTQRVTPLYRHEG